MEQSPAVQDEQEQTLPQRPLSPHPLTPAFRSALLPSQLIKQKTLPPTWGIPPTQPLHPGTTIHIQHTIHQWQTGLPLSQG